MLFAKIRQTPAEGWSFWRKTERGGKGTSRLSLFILSILQWKVVFHTDRKYVKTVNYALSNWFISRIYNNIRVYTKIILFVTLTNPIFVLQTSRQKKRAEPKRQL